MYKIGTLQCMLFGHIFLVEYESAEAGLNNHYIKPTNYCTRCGILKEDLKEIIKK